MEELLVKLQTWKSDIKKIGLQVNIGKTKIMVSGFDSDLSKKPLRCLSERSMQQCNLLWWLFVLDSQEM